jgi:uncharacterized protein YjbJ (UPF0337 family)
MHMWNKDEREGKIAQVKGKVKQAVGDLTNNDRLKAEGQKDEVSGNVQEAVGQIRRTTGEAIDAVVEAAKQRK